jgi:hypothetical protein
MELYDNYLGASGLKILTIFRLLAIYEDCKCDCMLLYDLNAAIIKLCIH